MQESYLPNNYNISGSSSSGSSGGSSGENSGGLPLPPRAAHPIIICNNKQETADSYILENFPYDKYEVDPSSPFAELFGSKQPMNSNSCWHVYIKGSNGNPTSNGEPFGFIKFNASTNSAFLYVLPYNFPKLWPLLGIRSLQASLIWKMN